MPRKEYNKLTLSEQLMVQMVARLKCLDPDFVASISDEICDHVLHHANLINEEG